MTDITLCPRCAHQTIEKLAASPVAGEWDVLQCQCCLYMWRTTEPARRTERAAYPAEFQMTQAGIDDAPEMPVIPPLRMGA